MWYTQLYELMKNQLRLGLCAVVTNAKIMILLTSWVALGGYINICFGVI